MRIASIVFLLAAAAQWLVPLAGIWRHERIIARGSVVRIRCAAPDPYDALRGRYLAVRPAESRLPTPEGMPDGDVVPVWATLVADADGLSRIESLSLAPVSGPTVIRLVARRRWFGEGGSTVFIEWPFDRFYLNERLAPDADTIVADLFQHGGQPVAEFRLLDGRAILTDVLIDGTPIREVVRHQKR